MIMRWCAWSSDHFAELPNRVQTLCVRVRVCVCVFMRERASANLSATEIISYYVEFSFIEEARTVEPA